MSVRRLGLSAGLLLAVAARSAGAQNLAQRLESGADGRLAIRFAARPDVCGSATLLRIGSASWLGGDWWSSRSGGTGDGSCERLPAEVLVTRADGRIVEIRVGMAGAPLPSGTADLGTVSSAQAGRAFLDLAVRLDGRAGREALLAAAVADSAPTWRGLVAIVGNQRASRGLRESAASWLGREMSTAGPGDAALLGRALSEVARDREVPISVRTGAVSALARTLGRPAPELVELAGSGEPAIAKAALAGLGRSDDPAARAVLQRAADNPELATALRIQAIRSLGDRDASPSDLDAIRALWPGLESQARGAVLDVVAGAGGGDNARWLLALASDDDEPGVDRARAVQAAERAGAGSDQLVALYDRVTDRKVREAIVDALARIGDRTSLAKIRSIAKTDTDPALRRAAVRRLAAVGGDEAREALTEIVR